MGTVPFDCRYSVIEEKNPREIVLLRGKGCQWRRCRFCDYHLDFCKDQKENFLLNSRVLEQIRGIYGRLEVINSGSFCDLDKKTIEKILSVCQKQKITALSFECHWMHREQIPGFKAYFAEKGISVKMKIGVETFDERFRESYLDKGMKNVSPEEIAVYFDQVCLLQGIPGQTADSMRRDIETGLSLFERVCVNIMTPNTKPILPDPEVVSQFLEQVEPFYRENPRVDILLNNTDFGVGV